MAVGVAEERGGCSFGVYVTPRAGRTEIAGEREGALWVRLAAPPVEGAATRTLIALLAERLGVPKRAVALLSGAAGRQKRVHVEGLSAPDCAERLARLLTPTAS